MRVLIIKMSSMGDIIHTLPALTDALQAIPGIQFDWVVEEGFVEIPRWHKAVERVIPIALRRWRKKNFWQAIKSGEIKRFRAQLQSSRYDLIIDAQASIKSALVTYFAKGTRCGLDQYSVRERFANLAYEKKYSVSRQQHAIKHLRQLFATILGYDVPNTIPDYGIDLNRLPILPIVLPERYLVFVPNTHWPSKQWPEANWIALIKLAGAGGFKILLPWGNPQEHELVQRLAATDPNVQVLPKLKLTEIASILSNATAAVCVDTGLSHLAAALNLPNITLYGPTDPALIGTLGKAQIHMQGSASFHDLHPEQVWIKLESLLH
jgi:heptosyltransferase-1